MIMYFSATGGKIEFKDEDAFGKKDVFFKVVSSTDAEILQDVKGYHLYLVGYDSLDSVEEIFNLGRHSLNGKQFTRERLLEHLILGTENVKQIMDMIRSMVTDGKVKMEKNIENIIDLELDLEL